MYSYLDIAFGFIITWIVGLLPAYIVRFEIKKKPIKKRYAILLAILFWFVHLFVIASIKIYVGDDTRIGSAIGLVALVSFFMLIYKNENDKEKKSK